MHICIVIYGRRIYNRAEVHFLIKVCTQFKLRAKSHESARIEVAKVSEQKFVYTNNDEYHYPLEPSSLKAVLPLFGAKDDCEQNSRLKYRKCGIIPHSQMMKVLKIFIKGDTSNGSYKRYPVRWS